MNSKYLKDLQSFIYALQYESFSHIDLRDVPTQSQMLDYFIQILDCITSLYKRERAEVHLHPEFFIFPKTKIGM